MLFVSLFKFLSVCLALSRHRLDEDQQFCARMWHSTVEKSPLCNAGFVKQHTLTFSLVNVCINAPSAWCHHTIYNSVNPWFTSPSQEGPRPRDVFERCVCQPLFLWAQPWATAGEFIALASLRYFEGETRQGMDEDVPRVGIQKKC